METLNIVLHLFVLTCAGVELWLTWRIRANINSQVEDFAKTQRAAQTARFASVAALCVIATAVLLTSKAKLK